MKKVISLVLALITLLFCLVGCDNSKDIVLTDEDIHTDYAGVYLTLSSVDDSGEHKKLNAIWHNETFKEVTYGEGYKIEYLEDGEWKSVLKGEHIVSSIANLLKAKGTNEKSYSTDLFDLSKEGTYRLIQSLPTVTVNGKKHKFLNGVGFGIDGYCCEVGHQLKSQKKHPNYTAIAIKGLLFHFKPVRATVVVDGQQYDFKKVWIAPTMFGRYYGGGMILSLYT